MADLVEMEVNFKNWKVPELKKYLQDRRISVFNKKKDELLELTEKAHELGLELTDNVSLLVMLWTRSCLQKMVQSQIPLTSILTGALIFLMPQTLPGEICTVI